MVIDLFQKHLEQYILKISGLLEIANPHAFLQLKFSSKVDWKRYDIVYIIIEKVLVMLFFVQAYEKNLGLDEIHIYNRWISFSIEKKLKSEKKEAISVPCSRYGA